MGTTYMEPTRLEVELTLIEPMLGTTPGNKELATTYQAEKHPKKVQEDEEEAIERIPEDNLTKASTIFPKDEGGFPFIWDYQIKGFFKDACSMLRRVVKNEKAGQKGTLSSKLTAHKKIIDGLVFVCPRQISVRIPGPSLTKPPELAFTERPLRAPTPQGERVALVRSETIPAGTQIRFSISLLDVCYKPYVEEWLNYGKLRGLGQWRNSGMGRFTWKYTDAKAMPNPA